MREAIEIELLENHWISFGSLLNAGKNDSTAAALRPFHRFGL